MVKGFHVNANQLYLNWTEHLNLRLRVIVVNAVKQVDIIGQ